jgi:hypothetical protein
MSATENTENASLGSRGAGSLTGWFANLLAGIREGQALARRYDQLNRFSPTELVHRGLTRDDVSRLVVRDCARRRYEERA